MGQPEIAQNGGRRNGVGRRDDRADRNGRRPGNARDKGIDN
jgi:hypothetical protein